MSYIAVHQSSYKSIPLLLAMSSPSLPLLLSPKTNTRAGPYWPQERVIDPHIRYNVQLNILRSQASIAVPYIPQYGNRWATINPKL